MCVCVFQAFKSQICLDLSPNHQYDGRLTGHRVVNWDIKVRYEAFSIFVDINLVVMSHFV